MVDGPRVQLQKNNSDASCDGTLTPHLFNHDIEMLQQSGIVHPRWVLAETMDHGVTADLWLQRLQPKSSGSHDQMGSVYCPVKGFIPS